MAKSRTRRNRRQKRAAAALVATTAAAGLAFGTTIQAAPAHALDLELPLNMIATCGPGEPADIDSAVSADCTDADASLIATAGDWLIQQLGVDFPLTLSSLNRATAIGLDFSIPNPFPIGDDDLVSLTIPAHASISGMGFNSATAVFGDASANARDPFSGALAVGVLSNSSADALLGLGLSLGIGGIDPENFDVLDLLDPDSLKSETKASALPLGVPMSIVLLTSDKASSTALGGIALAKSSLYESEAVCTAVYAQASVTDSEGNNKSSCTSVLFIFQQSQQGDGPVVYAIKNPFSIDLVSPLPVPNLASLVGALPDGLIDDDMMVMLNLLSGNFVPKFNQDLIRITMGPNGPEFGSDLFGNTASSAGGTTVTATSDEDALRTAGEPAEREEQVEIPAVPVPGGGAAEDEAAEVDAPKVDEPEVDEPKVDEPEADEPKVDEPKVDEPEADEPKADEPKVDTGENADEPEAAADL